ncbi:MAG: glutamate 5-kinase [Caldimicrobium sp.]|nr:glutamate 5-kinase [Caldimicrobium sp.]MCX7613042.1 glutamate 5-kinase [Caldimicrobium sp.]MDW8182807.1 glutamate 5-kinase [Caldimicrobium sp.]
MKRDRGYFLQLLQKARSLVIKIGSAVITRDDEGLNYEVLSNLAYEVQRFLRENKRVIIVSSGAIACGRAKLNLYKKPISLSEKQALAALGQADLIHAYEEVFSKYHLKVAQVLLTSEDLSIRNRYTNARKTLQTLLNWGVVPVINENDTVATDEIKFSDNDILSALVAIALPAEALLILSDVDSLYAEDPRLNPQSERIGLVEEVTEAIFHMAGKKPGKLGRGGMYSKLLSAKMVTTSGIPMAILPGRTPLVFEKLFSGEEIGTVFLPQERRLPLRKIWIRYYLKPEGKLILDQGAVKALLEEGRSLLMGGVKEIEGNFSREACVECHSPEGKPLAKGLVNYSSEELRRFLTEGFRPEKEIIHRDNLVLL